MSTAETHARGAIAFLAYHDPLTGLANRAALEDALMSAVVEARAAGTSVALAFADLNEFKRVNYSLGHDPQATAVSSAIMRLADACGCDVVAEGVEDADHAEFLSANGCRIAEDFHFSRPVPAPDCTALLEASIAPERRRWRRRTSTALLEASIAPERRRQRRRTSTALGGGGGGAFVPISARVAPSWGVRHPYGAFLPTGNDERAELGEKCTASRCTKSQPTIRRARIAIGRRCESRDDLGICRRTGDR